MVRLGKLYLAFIFMLWITACSNPKSQSSNLKSQIYSSPVDFDILLAGNFGEPRPWHFHGGLDIKTNNEEGKQVFSVADGYVSRLTVNMYGFGNAIYVCHPDGHTSVYAHLQRFAPQYEAMLHRTGKDTLSLVFSANQYPVKAGDLIAISGNTGHSTGPHLHLEIHDTETWVMRDPMAFLGHLIADTVAPQAHSFMAIPMQGEGVFNDSQDKQTFSFSKEQGARGRGQENTPNSDKSHAPCHSPLAPHPPFTAWGRVGFALWADDYAQDTYHHYGIRYMQLLVDGREVFRSDVDSIPISCQPEVNKWGDYDHWRRTRIWYMKAYREPRMRLPILHTDIHRGIVNFNEERPYHLTFVLRDYQNNQATYHFTVQGRRNKSVRLKPTGTLLNDYRLFRQCLWPYKTTRF